MTKAKLLMADDHAIVAEGIRRLLEAEYEVVGCVSDGRTLVTEAVRLDPDGVVLDIGMPELNGIEAARQLRCQAPRARVVILTQQAGREYIQNAFRAGASAYVLKTAAAGELRMAIREALAGQFYVSSQLRQHLPEALISPQLNPGELFGSTLTGRQREVLQLVAEGKTAKEIASALNISVKTVEFHKMGIMEELGSRTTAELTRYALEHGIISA